MQSLWYTEQELGDQQFSKRKDIISNQSGTLRTSWHSPIQDIPGGKLNILGSHSISHSKQKKMWNTCTCVLFRTVSDIDYYTYCQVSGVPWLIITSSGMDDWIYCRLLYTLHYNYNQWLTKTRSIPYWTMRVFSFTVTDLILIYESVTSSASVVRWLTLHSWTLKLLNSLTTEWLNSRILMNWTLLRMNHWISQGPLFITSRRTECRSFQTVFCPLLRNIPSDLLPSNGGPSTVDCVTSATCLPKRCLAMVIFVIILYHYIPICTSLPFQCRIVQEIVPKLTKCCFSCSQTS
jgi:hypothetical protein